MFKALLLAAAVVALAWPARAQVRPSVAASAAFRNAGTAPGDVPVLDANSHLPASMIGGAFPFSQLSGVAATAQLGTGTPTSTTFLRGDGSWAGMTPGGNTLASTGNLFMGDGAGNAAAVGNDTDLLRVLQTRLQTVVAAQSQPVNLLPAVVPAPGYNGLTTGSINADGTITVPASGYVGWTIFGDAGNLPLYAYAVATTDQPSGAIHIDAGSTNAQSTVAPGVYRGTFNSSSSFQYHIYVRNQTASAITIYYPVMAYQDTGLALLASHSDYVAVASQPVADLDFTRFESADRSGRYVAERQTTLAFENGNGIGNNHNAGTLYAPLQSLTGSGIANGNIVGLYRGSLFPDSLPFSTLGNTHGLVAQDVALGSEKALPIVSGLDQVQNSGFTSNGDGTYSIQWTPTDGASVTNDGYNNVFVVEINTLTEAAAPIASRRRMTDVTSNALVASTPGAVYVTSFGGGWLGRLHPSDGLAPGSGAYRYEVVSRVAPANWGAPANVGDGAMGGVELIAGSNGYGALGGPTGFVGDRLAFVHATTHSAVLGGGSLQRSLFYETGHGTSGSGSCIQLVWYAASSAGLRWDLRHCLFYGATGIDPAYFILSHNGGGAGYDRGDIADCAFLAARRADGSLQGTAIDYQSVITGTINRVYVQGVSEIFGFNMPLTTEVKNSVFRSVHTCRVGGNFHDNVVALESGADPNNPNNTYPLACVFQQSGASATNNLLWARGVAVAGLPASSTVGGLAFYSGSVANCTFARNVVVLNPADASTPTYMPQVPNQSTMSIDYNLVINLAVGGFSAYNGAAGYTSWAAYQAGTGLDAHSLYVDLSADPRGINAVFANAAAGDFRWAQTDVARRCAAYCAANGVGPAAVTSRWPLVPNVDDAWRAITGL